MDKLTWSDFAEKMYRANSENRKVTGVVVFSADSFKESYPEKSRSYRVSSMEKYFNAHASGRSLYGNCLDGADDGVRLDLYMYREKDRWNPEYCYFD